MKRKELPDLLSHIEREHFDAIPKNQTVGHFYYMSKTGRDHGNCVICKRDTTFNEATGKYNRMCTRDECREKSREIFAKRMIGKYGKVSILDDPEQQKKMLANRSISGKYKWSDGKEFTYTGSYEKDFLQFLDLFMGFESNDVMAPSPHTYYYMYEGKKKFYIPDFFIPSLNMEIEVKEGSLNPNTHHKIQAVDKVKEKLKDEVLMSQKHVSYVKVLDKQYNNFMATLINMKKHLLDTGEYAQVFDLGDNIQPTIKYFTGTPVKESIDADVLRGIISGNPDQEIFDYIKEEFYVPDDILEEMDMIIESIGKTPEELLEEIKEISEEEAYDINFHGVGDFLKSKGFIGKMDKTPGFTSAYLGNLFIDIVDRLTCEVPDMEYVRECLCGQFREALEKNATPEEVKRYKRDKTAMDYYFKLLASKMDQNVLFFVETSSYLKDIVTEVTYKVEGREAHPVFVLLTHTGTVLSNAIKYVTDKPYSHASIAFDESLEEMYSFGRRHKDNPFVGTFVRENIRSGLYEDVSDKATFALYVTFMTKEEIESVKERLKYFEREDVEFRYSFKGLINYKMGKESDSVDKFFCSQFVDYILSSAKPFFDRPSSLVEPYDYASHKAFTLVDKGVLKDYDVKKARSKVSKIATKAKFNDGIENDKVIYIALGYEEATTKEIRTERESNIIFGARSIPDLKKLMNQEGTKTHYTVIPTSTLKRNIIGLTDDNMYIIELPKIMSIKNINKL